MADGRLAHLPVTVQFWDGSVLQGEPPVDERQAGGRSPITLRRWVSNLLDHGPEAERLVGPERVRTWHLYMLASATAFDQAEIGLYQVLGVRYDGPHGLPLTRADLLRAYRVGSGASDSARRYAGPPTPMRSSVFCCTRSSDILKLGE